MAEWNSRLYLRFEQQRTQPALDLAQRVAKYAPGSIADLGCGPGNSTAVLKNVFPRARLVGVDSSENMLDKARKAHPDIEFLQADIRQLTGGYDLLFSNACLQWVPDHDKLLPMLMDKLNAHGVLAVQVPNNGQEPLMRIIQETAEQSPFDFSSAQKETNGVLCTSAYYDILSGCASDFDIWETVYHHALPSHEELINWVRGSRLRPYLACLNEEEKAAFEAELLRRVRAQYAPMRDGNVVLKFRRLFFVARK